MEIPFHKPLYDASDEAALLRPLRNGRLVGDAEYTNRATAALSSLLGVEHVLLTTSCTHALELAMMALGIRPGDEVIVPSFTFVSSTNCVMRQGARVVFADVEAATLTLDLNDVRRRVTSKTRAIIPVVYAGVSPDMDTFAEFARERKIVLVEDAAQGVGALYKEHPAGTIGDIGCFSFHETKNFSTGEGGAFATRNSEYMKRAEIIREKGTNRKQFIEGLVDKYTWVDVGSSYLPSDTMGALLLNQLEKRDFIQQRREEIHLAYLKGLSALAQKGRLVLPAIPRTTRSNYHIFHVLMPDENIRNRALAFFREKGIGTAFHYLPLHLSPVGRSLGYSEGDFPVTESVSGRLLRLPIYPELSARDQLFVIESMEEFFRK